MQLAQTQCCRDILEQMIKIHWMFWPFIHIIFFIAVTFSNSSWYWCVLQLPPLAAIQLRVRCVLFVMFTTERENSLAWHCSKWKKLTLAVNVCEKKIVLDTVFLLSSFVIRNAQLRALVYSIKHWLKLYVRFIFRSADPSAMESVCMGATARCISGASLLPFTVIKTRFEVITCYVYTTVWISRFGR